MVLTLFTIFSENLFLKLNFVCFKSLILCARVVGTCHDKFYPKLLKYFSLTNELSVVEENMLKEEDQKKCREAI